MLSNSSITSTRLNEEAKRAIVNDLLKTGSAEWDDDAHTRMLLIFKTPETLAGEIYTWVRARPPEIYTLYALHSEYEDSGMRCSHYTNYFQPLCKYRMMHVFK